MTKQRVHEVELFYETSGGEGPPLVLVHGSWGDHHNWDAVVPELARSFRVLTYDRRGHSESERPAAFSGMRDDVADLAALIDATGFGPAHVVGNSGGAAVALRLAAEHPFDGAGHVPHMSHPEAYVRVVADFVRGADASTQ